MGEKKKATPKETAIGLLILGVIVLAIWLFSGDGETPKPEPFTEINALVMSREFVRDKLKAPASAEFGEDISGVRKRADGTFWVESYVDAENGFGAKLRNQYECLITYDPATENVNCSELKIR